MSKTCTKAHDMSGGCPYCRIIELEAEAERVRRLVRSAYCEGYTDGQCATLSYENDSHDGTTLERDWDGSESKIELGDVCRFEEECK